ncbi:ANTAR domain-containing protein [Rhodococcus sp. NPDC049939]|uniref:ANTAR domain-containing protein n=1 Tax=Rhodococcus sp. NPDC049939 TaxID=3155511 RepID=UPI0033F26A95
MAIEARSESRALQNLSALDGAIQILTTARGNAYSTDQASDELLDTSMRHQVDLGDLAEALVDIAQGVQAVADERRRARDVVRQEWGALLQLL